MLQSLSVAWTVTPREAPRPWIACARCGGPRLFRPSGRFRLNANGRLLDAWLIYRCSACEATWNRPVLARRPVREVDPALLSALQSNDPALARRVAFDRAGLRHHSARIEDCPDVDLGRQLVAAAPADHARLSIRIQPVAALSLRLDRLLAIGLALSRGRIERLAATGALALDPAGAIRQPPARPLTAHIDLEGQPDSAAILAAALGARGARDG